jgi:hypothetical protein
MHGREIPRAAATTCRRDKIDPKGKQGAYELSTSNPKVV